MTGSLRLPPAFWIAAAGLGIGSLAGLYCLQQWNLAGFVVCFALQVTLYGFAAWHVHGRGFGAVCGERNALIAVLIVAALLRAIAFFAPQSLSTDAFRYVWDGRVQAAGENPYRYIPADPALRGLRDDVIYPNINRADYARTIYPPAAQLVFLAAERISDSIWGMKGVMLAFDALSIGCLIALLRIFGMPPSRVLLYAWHPLPLWEFAGSGHVDAVAIALLLLALVFAVRRSSVWAGVALAAATLIKYYPIVALPALYRRWDWRMPTAFVATLIVLYLPYVGVGRAVAGFLPGYVDEEGLGSGSGFFLWALLQEAFDLPREGLHYYLPFAVLVMGLLACWVQFGGRGRTEVAPAARDTLLLASAFTLLVSPHNPWYFVWLVPLLCFRFSAAHLWLTTACVVIYVSPWPVTLGTQLFIYVPFFLLLLTQYRLGRFIVPPEIRDANRTRNPSAA